VSLVDLAVLYGVAGAGCALAAVGTGRAADAPLLLVLWPLYGPFVLAGRFERGPSIEAVTPPDVVDRFERELNELGELLIRLGAHGEVGRVAGWQQPAVRRLVRELADGAAKLDRLLDETENDAT
jgi:hypothetical protein